MFGVCCLYTKCCALQFPQQSHSIQSNISRYTTKIHKHRHSHKWRQPVGITSLVKRVLRSTLHIRINTKKRYCCHLRQYIVCWPMIWCVFGGYAMDVHIKNSSDDWSTVARRECVTDVVHIVIWSGGVCLQLSKEDNGYVNVSCELKNATYRHARKPCTRITDATITRRATNCAMTRTLTLINSRFSKSNELLPS